jgi:malate/lactate dehydrogenase
MRNKITIVGAGNVGASRAAQEVNDGNADDFFL